MTPKRLVVIGASAGGIEAVRHLLAGLPASFPAAICVVIHLGPESPGILADIFGRVSALPVSAARNRERLKNGHVYVASPDFHLVVEPGLLRVTKGPRENGFRPAIDPLFRSAAQVFGPAATGVVLTGNLDDGTAGLWVIKRLGGIAIVQDPDEAMFPSMPRNAAQNVDVDYTVPLSRIPSLLGELTSEPAQEARDTAVPEHIGVEVNIAKEQNPREAGLERLGRPSPYACPECHGVLLELNQEGRLRFRCHTGHAYSIDTLLAAISEAIRHEMGTAVRTLEEGAFLIEGVVAQFEKRQDPDAVARMTSVVARMRRQAEVIRELSLEELEPAHIVAE